MDVVKTTIESLRGRVQLSSKPGEGTHLTMIVPLTLAFLDAMVVRSDEHLFVLPIEKIFEVFKVQPSGIAKASADDALMVKVRGQLVPVLWLHHYYGERSQAERLDERILIVVQTSRGKLALPVDEILGNHQVMLKPLRGILSGVRAAAGCGMLSTGDVAIALDCEQLRA
jgi:two-component system chemotaxis sensor kinase CheA